MEYKVLIVSIACFSCLMPPVFSLGILKAKAVKLGAAKGAALLGAKALVAKGAGALVAKGAAAIAAKDAIVAKAFSAIVAKGLFLKGLLRAKGMALLAAKGAALKGALAAKGAKFGGAAALGPKVVKVGAGIIAAKLRVQPKKIMNQPEVILPAPVIRFYY